MNGVVAVGQGLLALRTYIVSEHFGQNYAALGVNPAFERPVLDFSDHPVIELLGTQYLKLIRYLFLFLFLELFLSDQNHAIFQTNKTLFEQSYFIITNPQIDEGLYYKVLEIKKGVNFTFSSG